MKKILLLTTRGLYSRLRIGDNQSARIAQAAEGFANFLFLHNIIWLFRWLSIYIFRPNSSEKKSYTEVW